MRGFLFFNPFRPLGLLTNPHPHNAGYLFVVKNFVMAIAVIAGVAFGGETGFLVGSIMLGKLDRIKVKYGIIGV